MKKRIVVHLIVIVVSAAIGAYLANILHANAKGSKFNSVSTSFSSGLAGFNKFASDIQWMLFVNYSGSIKSVDSENAPIVFKKLKSIVDNDPGFEKAYEMGSLMLSVEAPEKALEILDKGIACEKLQTNWKIPFYAGYIALHHLQDKNKDANLDRAENYFKKAVERSQGSEKHVVSQLLHAKARKLNGKKFFDKESNKSIPITSEKQARLLALYKEWKAMDGLRRSSSSDSAVSSMGVLDLDDMLLSAMQSAMRSEQKDQDICDSVAIIRRDVFAGRHLCEACMSQYSEGDKFCSSCGVEVKLYGICPKCSSVLKGRFCSKCGNDSVGSAK